MIRRPPRSTQSRSSAASDVYKRQPFNCPDLIPEYFDLALNEFKQEQNKLLGKIYNDSDAFFEFIKNEVDKMQKSINGFHFYYKKTLL